MSQTTSDKAVCWIADHFGVCWLSLLLWKDGIMGRRYSPIHRCKNCEYCGKHLEIRA